MEEVSKKCPAKESSVLQKAFLEFATFFETFQF